MRTIRPEQFAEPLEWHPVCQYRLLVRRDMGSESGQGAEARDG